MHAFNRSRTSTRTPALGCLFIANYTIGPSSGFNVAGAVWMAAALGPGHTIVTILCDPGSNYLSKSFNDRMYLHAHCVFKYTQARINTACILAPSHDQHIHMHKHSRANAIKVSHSYQWLFRMACGEEDHPATHTSQRVYERVFFCSHRCIRRLIYSQDAEEIELKLEVIN